MLFQEKEHVALLSTVLTLLMAGEGVYRIVKAKVMDNAFDMLLETGEYTLEEKASNKIIGPISGIYWLIAVAIYLFWSYSTNDWEITWMVWPIAGVLYGAMMIIIKLSRTYKK